METSLHRQLKEVYAAEDAQVEVRLGRYRIDVVRDGRLVEIQHGSLAAIRDKIAALVRDHPVTVVKPIVARKLLIKQASRGGREVSRRASPKRGCLLDLFEELVYFTRVFPHRNLTVEVLLVEIEEYRFPGHGRRRYRRDNDFQVEDQKLVRIGQTHRFNTARDLLDVLPGPLPQPFHTGDLAELLGVSRWVAQRVAYCFRETGAAVEVGKTGNARLYELPAQPTRPRRKTAGKRVGKKTASKKTESCRSRDSVEPRV